MLWVTCGERNTMDIFSPEVLYIYRLLFYFFKLKKYYSAVQDSSSMKKEHVVPFIWSWIFKTTFEITQYVLCELNCPCLTAAAHLSARLALNCHKMQFCTLVLRLYRHSNAVRSAFSRKGNDSSRRVNRRTGVLIFPCYYSLWPWCHMLCRGHNCQRSWGQSTEKTPSAALSEIPVREMLWIPKK